MKIIVKSDINLENIINIIRDIEDIEVECVDSINNFLKECAIYVVFCNAIEIINNYKRMKNKNVLICTDNLNETFLYTIIQTLHPLDIVYIDKDSESIKNRITSIICMVESENNEKNI